VDSTAHFSFFLENITTQVSRYLPVYDSSKKWQRCKVGIKGGKRGRALEIKVIFAILTDHDRENVFSRGADIESDKV